MSQASPRSPARPPPWGTWEHALGGSQPAGRPWARPACPSPSACVPVGGHWLPLPGRQHGVCRRRPAPRRPRARCCGGEVTGSERSPSWRTGAAAARLGVRCSPGCSPHGTWEVPPLGAEDVPGCALPVTTLRPLRWPRGPLLSSGPGLRVLSLSLHLPQRGSYRNPPRCLLLCGACAQDTRRGTGHDPRGYTLHGHLFAVTAFTWTEATRLRTHPAGSPRAPGPPCRRPATAVPAPRCLCWPQAGGLGWGSVS